MPKSGRPLIRMRELTRRWPAFLRKGREPAAPGVTLTAVKIVSILTLLAALAGCADDQALRQASAGDTPATTASTSAGSSANIETRPGEKVTATRKPIPVSGGGASVALDLKGYGPGTTADVTYGGDLLATLTASADGGITGPVTLPEAPAGVQVLTVEGATSSGVMIGHDLRLLYPGNPRAGQDFSIYVEGFEPRPDYIESTYEQDEVAATLEGFDFSGLFDTTVDVDGGVLLTLPIPAGHPSLELVVTSQKTGVVKTIVLEVSD